MKRVILVAPHVKGDKFTVITSDWGRQLLPLFASNGWTCEAIVGSDATRKRVVAALQAELGKQGLFVFLDHGSADALAGCDGPVIDASNVALLANKVVYAIACDAAKTLGSLALKKGVCGFLGFQQKYYIWPSSPQVYGRCLLSGLKAMITEGSSLDQARQRIVLETNLQVGRLKESPDFQPAGPALDLSGLIHNRDNVVSLGDPDVCFS